MLHKFEYKNDSFLITAIGAADGHVHIRIDDLSGKRPPFTDVAENEAIFVAAISSFMHNTLEFDKGGDVHLP